MMIWSLLPSPTSPLKLISFTLYNPVTIPGYLFQSFHGPMFFSSKSLCSLPGICIATLCDEYSGTGESMSVVLPLYPYPQDRAWHWVHTWYKSAQKYSHLAVTLFLDILTLEVFVVAVIVNFLLAVFEADWRIF